ncbi:DUF302 domain-containing protein [Campylobacter sp. 19-13652]|uniref:DUF302 domain-containing protein n=1 Tax=Campylobacter sp. 19-13652 TaxID=2840180 RepID=UPI001C741B77|nr:DUF302 domain-containing protein [Campylobacter sp. 19-13652]BCX78930.1 hypothetical protein LBC_03920 [Campylobacter sp. 19-13652]
MKKLALFALLASVVIAEQITLPSQNDFSTTLEKAKTAIVANGNKIFAEFDHKAEATDVGLKMSEASVIVFGKPKVGTNLMVDDAKISLKLPLKLAIFNQNSKTYISYEDPNEYKYELKNSTPILGKMSEMLKKIATIATSK